MYDPGMTSDSACWKHLTSACHEAEKSSCNFRIDYPLVNCPITMENHHFSWKNSLFLWPFSTAFDSWGKRQKGQLLWRCIDVRRGWVAATAGETAVNQAISWRTLFGKLKLRELRGWCILCFFPTSCCSFRWKIWHDVQNVHWKLFGGQMW